MLLLKAPVLSRRFSQAVVVCVIAACASFASAKTLSLPDPLDISINDTVNAKLDSALVDPKVGGILVVVGGTEYGSGLDDYIWAGCCVLDVENIVDDYSAFCMDVTTDPARSYIQHTAMGVSSDLEYMWGTYYEDIFDGVGNMAVDAAAFQLAVWEVVHETSGTYDVATGNFYLSSLNTGSSNNNGATMSGLISQANSYLDSNNWTDRETLAALTASGHQPMLVAITPEPATLSLLALGGMAMLRRRRAA